MTLITSVSSGHKKQLKGKHLQQFLGQFVRYNLNSKAGDHTVSFTLLFGKSLAHHVTLTISMVKLYFAVKSTVSILS